MLEQEKVHLVALMLLHLLSQALVLVVEVQQGQLHLVLLVLAVLVSSSSHTQPDK